MFSFDKNLLSKAIIDGDTNTSFTYGDLCCDPLSCNRSLIFLFCRNLAEEIAIYASLINQGHVLALFDSSLAVELKRNLIEIYHPQYIVSVGYEKWPGYSFYKKYFSSLCVWKDSSPKYYELHPDLCLLLSTSGTTGSPKMVRLSQKNILSNARSICEYLHLSRDERPITSLPIHYSYGLSVINSHLLAGATIVATQSSYIQAKFWEVLSSCGCTSMAGVPYTYECLDKINAYSLEIPSLKTMTQAGGRLAPDLITKFNAWIQNNGGHFYVMYGQTEATARIAYLPQDYLHTKNDAIGIAIPGGKLAVSNHNKPCAPREVGEIIYYGPNVMMGYADKLEDLSLGDLLGGELKTGDLGYYDEDGIYYVVGRLKRYAKIYGLRVNLEEIEAAFLPKSKVAALANDKNIFLFFEGEREGVVPQAQALCLKLHLNQEIFKFHQLDQLPITPSGKIDYTKLGQECSH